MAWTEILALAAVYLGTWTLGMVLAIHFNARSLHRTLAMLDRERDRNAQDRAALELKFLALAEQRALNMYQHLRTQEHQSETVRKMATDQARESVERMSDLGIGETNTELVDQLVG